MTLLSLSDVPASIAAVPRGRMLALIGLEASLLQTTMEHAGDETRQLLRSDVAGCGGVDAVIDRILNDLAALALALWPTWYAGAEPDTMVGAGVLQPWRRAASRLAASKTVPRFRHTPSKIELAQLLLAIDPAGLVLLAAIDVETVGQATAVIAALEWCASASAAVVILCPRWPPPSPPFDRILYGAREVTQPTAPVLSRLIVPQGKARGGSAVEARMRDALACDPDLAGLFEREVLVQTNPLGQRPRVDFLWSAGRIVVELDGREHERDPNYGADRHRDYELLVAGYLVLRLTNDEVERDLARCVDKVRRVVNLRRGLLS